MFSNLDFIGFLDFNQRKCALNKLDCTDDRKFLHNISSFLLAYLNRSKLLASNDHVMYEERFILHKNGESVSL